MRSSEFDSNSETKAPTTMIIPCNSNQIFKCLLYTRARCATTGDFSRLQMNKNLQINTRGPASLIGDDQNWTEIDERCFLAYKEHNICFMIIKIGTRQHQHASLIGRIFTNPSGHQTRRQNIVWPIHGEWSGYQLHSWASNSATSGRLYSQNLEGLLSYPVALVSKCSQA